MALGRDLIMSNIRRSQELADRKYQGGLLGERRERMTGLLGTQGYDAMTPSAGFTPSGAPVGVQGTPESFAPTGPMADVPVGPGGAMTPLYQEDQAATGVSGSLDDRMRALSALAIEDPAAANAVRGAMTATTMAPQGAGGRALNAFGTFLDLDTGEAVNAGYDAQGSLVDTATGKRAAGKLVPYSDTAVKNYQSGKAQTREDQYIQEASPNDAYRRGYQVSDAGQVQTDPLTGRPVKLGNAEKTLKRGTTANIKNMGELYDDSREISALLAAPGVASVLSSAAEAGLTSEIMEKGKNTWRKFLQSKGVAGSDDPRVIEAITRMQKMASTSRKEYAGTAVSAAELKTLTPWLPDAGDSLSTMLGKMNVVESEGKQQFKRYLDIYKDQANMSPFYDAFGMDRFGTAPQAAAPSVQPNVVLWEDM